MSRSKQTNENVCSDRSGGLSYSYSTAPLNLKLLSSIIICIHSDRLAILRSTIHNIMTDHESLPIEEGGVDGEEFFLYLHASDHEKYCGRGGWRSNYFNYKEHRRAPPDAGSSIDVSLWRLIIKGITSEGGKVERHSNPVIMMVVVLVYLPFMILSSTLPDEASMADHPVQLVVFCVLAAIMLVSVIVGIPYVCRMKNKGYQKVVSAMAHRFQEQGFEIQFVVLYDCCIIACPYIRFTPTGAGRQVGQTEDHLGVFNIHDWKPLEGKWEMTETGPEKCWLFCTWTLEFQIVDSRSGQDQAMQQASRSGQDQAMQQALRELDEALNERGDDSLTIDDTHLSFVSKGNIHVRNLHGFLWRRRSETTRVSQTGKTTGNTHVINSATAHREIQAIDTITPIQTGGIASCYRWGPSSVLFVQGSKMLQIDFSYEELPPSSRLLSDASLFKDGGEYRWTEFQKNGFGGSGTEIV
jgi:hypothetical protein